MTANAAATAPYRLRSIERVLFTRVIMRRRGRIWRITIVNRNDRTGDRPAGSTPDFAAGHRPGRAEGSLSPARVRLHRLSRGRQRARLALEPTSEGLRHRHVGASLPGQETVSQLLDHRPALPPGACPLWRKDDRSR